MIPRIARVIFEFEPDVVHTHLAILKYVLPAMAVSRRCAVVHTFHNLAEKEAERPSRLVNRLAFRAGVHPVAIGEQVAASIRSVYGIAPARLIPNGIPLSHYAPAPGTREDVRRELGIPAEDPVLLTVAMFTPQKNHEGLLSAFASARLRAARARLLLAGDDPERRAVLERLAASLGCAERVLFLGARADVPRLLAAADAFVLASHYEGNPLAVMEAMAAGRAVVATAVGCVPELVTAGAGRLVAPGDPAALEEAMFAVATDPAARAEMGRTGAAVARVRFDDTVTARAYERLYVEATSGRRPTSRPRVAS
jgi:glycosyltransferase involved in cell wall biosynthesis